MYCEEQTELKKKMKDAGITIKAVSQRVKRPYSTIGGMLGGFTPMNANVKLFIDKMISEALKGKKND